MARNVGLPPDPFLTWSPPVVKLQLIFRSIAVTAVLGLAVGCNPPEADTSTSTDTTATDTSDSNTTATAETPDSNVTTGAETPAGETPE